MSPRSPLRARGAAHGKAGPPAVRASAGALAGQLLDWYDRHGRKLPWRGARSPWEVWVAEVMLQQTRVETVVVYYERFLERFPTPEALARSPLEEALAFWSGLGYYRRCRLLHRGAREILARGGWPEDPDSWRKIPGVGEYTAAAIASIVFGAAVPVLDGNTLRVAARVGALEEVVDRGPGRQQAATLLAGLLESRRAGDSNQALMDLGATVCTPRRPDCARCPLSGSCRALATGQPEVYPRRAARTGSRTVVEAAFVVEQEGRVLLSRRPESAQQLAGMWELPTAAGSPAEAAALLGERCGLYFASSSVLFELSHAITTRRIRLLVVGALLAEGGRTLAERDCDVGWFGFGELSVLPLTGATRKVLRELGWLAVRTDPPKSASFRPRG